MIDFSPYQVWLVRRDDTGYDDAEAWAVGPHSYVHLAIGNASRLQIPENADAWLTLIKSMLDGYEQDYIDGRYSSSDITYITQE